MSLVASETAVQRAAPAEKKDSDWKTTGVYMGNLDNFIDEAIVDVLKMTSRSSKLKNVPIPSISNEAWQAKDGLAQDPYNLKKINNLGQIYWKEGQHEQCLNVMIRGWKRAGEIEDEVVRFKFLMKICELSMGLWKYRQALAVFRDIAEPSDPKDLKSYLILGTQVWCQNGELQQGLKFFQRAIENESFQFALRVFAIVVVDLKKAGAYEAAKSTMDNLAGQPGNADIAMIDAFVEGSANRKAIVTPEMQERQLIIAAVVMGFIVLVGFLYWLESRSLASMSFTTKAPSARR